MLSCRSGGEFSANLSNKMSIAAFNDRFKSKGSIVSRAEQVMEDLSKDASTKKLNKDNSALYLDTDLYIDAAGGRGSGKVSKMMSHDASAIHLNLSGIQTNEHERS